MTGQAPPPPESFPLAEYSDESESRWQWVSGRYRQYSSALYGFFANRVSNPADANDLVQKVFVRVLQRGEGEPIEHVRGYLFQVANSVLNDEHRRATVRHEQQHESYEESEHGLHCEVSPENILLGEEAAQRVAAAIRQLPELTRDIYFLRVHQECEYTEIASLLGISSRSAQRHMAKALKHLAAVLHDVPLGETGSQGAER